MLIDWFTVSAQLINFLILVWLLKRFLYHPIIKAIDAREHIINNTLTEAQACHNEAVVEREKYERNNEILAQQRNALLIKASQEAEIERQRLLELAQVEANTLLEKRKQALIQEQSILYESIKQQTQIEIFAVAKKVLMDLAGIELEQQLLTAFLKRLAQLDNTQKQQLLIAIEHDKKPLLISSAFILSLEQQQAINKVLTELLDKTMLLEFLVNPQLISGIELIVGGQKLAWSVADYLATLEETVANIV
ncbi:MAG: F0F1 ATP synthase subunit B [Methylococcaceae bacterium]